MTIDYVDSDFADPTAVCDVIMKGGITSGVVYPLALTELAKQFRFSQVGGTSAGAIAASAAAAAEYGRHVPGKGFVLLAKLPAEVGKILFSLFQPTPKLKPLFGILVAAIGNDSAATKVMRVIGAALAGFAFAAAAASLEVGENRGTPSSASTRCLILSTFFWMLVAFSRLAARMEESSWTCVQRWFRSIW